MTVLLITQSLLRFTPAIWIHVALHHQMVKVDTVARKLKPCAFTSAFVIQFLKAVKPYGQYNP